MPHSHQFFLPSWTLGWTYSGHLIQMTQLTTFRRLDLDSGPESSRSPQLSRPLLQPSVRKRKSSCPEELLLPAYRLGCCVLLVSLHLPEEAFSSFTGRQLDGDSDDGDMMVISWFSWWLQERILHLTVRG